MQIKITQKTIKNGLIALWLTNSITNTKLDWVYEDDFINILDVEQSVFYENGQEEFEVDEKLLMDII